MFALLLAMPLRAETLADAISLAYRNNPTLESGRFDVRSADEGFVQARSELRPTAEFTVSGTYNRSIEGRASSRFSPVNTGASSTNDNQAEFSITQPLYTGGRATADRRVAEANVHSAREGLRSTEGDLLLEVITAYVDVRRFGAALEVWKASSTELEKITTEVEARQIAGELTRTDIAQAESQLVIAREQVVVSEESLEAARADYAELVGQNPGFLDVEPALPDLPSSAATAFDLAESRNPELSRSRYAELASRNDIIAARAAGRPTVSLRGSASLSGVAVPYYLHDQDQGYTGRVVFALPLSAGGRTASLVRQAEDRNSSDRWKIESTRRALYRNVSNAWNQMVTSRRQSALLTEQRHAAEIQLDGMISEYRVGLRSTFDVLYAQQSLRNIEVAQLTSGRDRYVSEATLLRQTGLLEAQALVTGVEIYDPATHLRSVVRKNALPWDGAIAAIDAIALPSPHRSPIERSRATGTPALVAPRTTPPLNAELSRSLPARASPGPIGQPSPSSAPSR
ncbi:MAG: hypothetical protein JWL66_1683 [Sphingomonadales bacterium]|nr:hypothetical protein [Sphingomonadales bacterium]